EGLGQEHAVGLGRSQAADLFEEPALGLLAHALDRPHAARHAGGLEVVERLDTERLVEHGDLVEPQAGDAGELERDGGHALALLLERLRAAGLVELRDHRGQRRADAGQGCEPARLDELAEVGVETLEDLGAAGVGSRLERLLTGHREEPGHLTQGPGDRQPISSHEISMPGLKMNLGPTRRAKLDAMAVSGRALALLPERPGFALLARV